MLGTSWMVLISQQSTNTTKNSNVTKDLNRNILSIQYNSLNLPSVIEFSDGKKLFKRVAEKDPTLKLLPNLPNTLIKQELAGECVVRALAFIMDYLKLKGNASYKSIYGNLKNIALAHDLCDIKVRSKGVPIVPPDMIDTIFNKYCGKVYNIPNYPLNIQKYIDAGIPVAIGKIEKDGVKHMVTVIGYDNDNFYVAAGNQDGTANIIPKSESGHTFIYSLIHL